MRDQTACACACAYLLLCLTFSFHPVYAQTADDRVAPLAGKYLRTVDDKLARFNTQTENYTRHALSAMIRVESRMREKVAAVDRSYSARLFDYAIDSLQKLRSAIASTATQAGRITDGNYFAYGDTLRQALTFLQSGGVGRASARAGKLTSSLQQLDVLETRMNTLATIRNFLQQRIRVLNEVVNRFPQCLSQLQQLNKTAYYYSAQVAQYTSVLKDPAAIERKMLDRVEQSASFQQLMEARGQLAGLFAPRSLLASAPLAGGPVVHALPSRAEVQQYIRKNMPLMADTTNVATQLQAKFVAAGTRLQESGGGAAEGGWPGGNFGPGGGGLAGIPDRVSGSGGSELAGMVRVSGPGGSELAGMVRRVSGALDGAGGGLVRAGSGDQVASGSPARAGSGDHASTGSGGSVTGGSLVRAGSESSVAGGSLVRVGDGSVGQPGSGGQPTGGSSVHAGGGDLAAGGSLVRVGSGFTPNHQRTKSFGGRIVWGMDMQFGRAVSYLPTTANIGVTAGYRLNDRLTTGIGIDYLMGMGTGWKDIHFSNQGAGLREYTKWQIKKGWDLQGGAEFNYMASFQSIARLRGLQNWQTSALLGISKQYKVSRKINGNFQILYDFLYRQHLPNTQPFLFRLGYDLK